MGESSQQQQLWFWAESCLKLANASDYRVSYWVQQEDKMKTRAVNHTIVATMESKLNGKISAEMPSPAGIVLGCSGGGSGDGGDESGGLCTSARASKRAKTESTTMTEKEVVSYFLMRDHRMEPRRGTPQTTVYFPEDCKHLRVYAFVECQDGVWKSYKDKVYSIINKKKEIQLTALNGNIKPYMDKPVKACD